jgi:hypothetical protein
MSTAIRRIDLETKLGQVYASAQKTPRKTGKSETEAPTGLRL